jgi:uncharacterized damage-inducible protein DinB
MASCSIFAEDNLRFLQQGLDLVQSLSDDAYTQSPHPDYTSGVGGHLRHCLDHYSNFLAGLPSGRIDYDARQRDERVENDRAYAIRLIRILMDGITEIRASDGEKALTIKMDGGDESDASQWWSQSSTMRELQFLVSHTVHHYALIAMILRAQGIVPAADFGVAPSTLRYNQSKLCAR